MIVEELVKNGAKVRIAFHDCKSLHEAYQKVSPFTNLGFITRGSAEGTRWLKIESSNFEIEVVAFYENKTKK